MLQRGNLCLAAWKIIYICLYVWSSIYIYKGQGVGLAHKI